ncbi:MAG: hypothetical protein QME28_05605 [Candidatus Saccharicenans sp.]|nr:hypothetical protein [Candidatus Saccharicenans sp.]
MNAFAIFDFIAFNLILFIIFRATPHFPAPDFSCKNILADHPVEKDLLQAPDFPDSQVAAQGGWFNLSCTEL